MTNQEMILEQYIVDGQLIYIITRHIYTNEYYFKVPNKSGFKTISSSYQGDFEKEKKKWAN